RTRRGVSTAPPPTATTAGSGPAQALRTKSASSERKAGSPSRANSSEMDPCARSSSSSTSTKARPNLCATLRPIVVFPAPMKPTRTMWRFRAFSAKHRRVTGRLCPPDALEVRAPRRDEVAERVAAELLLRRDRELPRNGGLGDDRERLHRGDVGALDERLRSLARLEVDRRERLHQRRQRLHRGAEDD